MHDDETTELGGASLWNLVADGYAQALLPQFELFARDAIARVGLAGARAILDVATGPGTLALMAASMAAAETSPRRGPRENAQENDSEAERPGESPAGVWAVDFSPGMIAALAARARAAGVPVRALVADAQALPLAGAHFDRVFCLFGLMFFPDPGAGLREMWRVLRPGGRAIVATWAPFVGPLETMTDLLLHHARLPGPTPELPLSDAADVAHAITRAGFSDVTVTQLTHDLPAPSLEHFWQGEQNTPLFTRVRRELGEAAWADVAARVLADLARQYGVGPLVAPATAHLAVATKAG